MAASASERALTRFLWAGLLILAVARLVMIFAVGLRDDDLRHCAAACPGALLLRPFAAASLASDAFAAVFGEGRLDRLPFLAINLLTGSAPFGLARRLFGAYAGWWTVFAFNACLHFLLLPEGYILPDQPLLLCLALVAWVIAEILYGPPGREAWLWALAGVSLGLAGLSKYSAAFAPLGLFGFFLLSPPHRRWLADPRPYVGAALGLACFAPALVWNAEHGWISFSFQAGRVASQLLVRRSPLGKKCSTICWRKSAC